MEQRALLSLPVVKFAPFLAAGMLTAHFLQDAALWIMVCAACAFFIFIRSKAAPCLAGFAAGLFIMCLYVAYYCEPILSYAGKTVETEFTVVEYLSGTENSLEFFGKMNLDGVTAYVRLSGEMLVEEGGSAVAVITLDKPDAQYLAQNLSKGILLCGEIEEYHSVRPAQFSLSGAIGAIRGELSSALRENVFGESGEMAMALLLGQDEFLPQTLSEQIKISGIAHYTSVSGAHFAILAAILLQFVPSNKPRLKAVLSILTAFAAVIFFGATASVMRASAMFMISAIAPVFKREAETLNTLCCAVSALLLISPGAVLDIGFGMSVLGVFGVGAVSPQLTKRLCELLPKGAKFLAPIIGALSASTCALICTAPISAAVFKGVSLCAVLTSILIMPLITIGMTFMILLGILNSGVFAVPIDLSMKMVLQIVRFFGKQRGMFLSLDFTGAWILALLCAVLLTVGAFGSFKVLRRCFEGAAVLALSSMLISQICVENRSEIRFVGNSRTSAAVAFQGREAVVFISGNGAGLADDISRCLRERGAVKISVLAAFEADYTGTLSIDELTGMVKTDKIITSGSSLSINGRTIASASVGDSGVSADIVLYHGNSPKNDCSAELGVFFVNPRRTLPENAVNVRVNKEFCVPLNAEKIIVKIENSS